MRRFLISLISILITIFYFNSCNSCNDCDKLYFEPVFNVRFYNYRTFKALSTTVDSLKAISNDSTIKFTKASSTFAFPVDMNRDTVTYFIFSGLRKDTLKLYYKREPYVGNDRLRIKAFKIKNSYHTFDSLVVTCPDSVCNNYDSFIDIYR